jgi:SsrA-binding protein
MKPYAENRKARHEYLVLETFEGGLSLTGAEVKAIREGGAKLDGAYVRFLGGRLVLLGAHIRPYSKMSGRETYDPDRTRAILVNKREMRQLAGKIDQKGLTLVPLSFYPSARRIKLSFALCRGKKAPDKREALKERDIMRQARRGRDEE